MGRGYLLNAAGYGLYVNSDKNSANAGKIYFQERDGAVNWAISSPGRLDDNTWHHIAAVRNQDGNTMQLYVDGELVSTRDCTASERLTTPPTLQFALGSRVEGVNQWAFNYAGLLCEASLWRSALTADEVAALMEGRPSMRRSGLVAYWGINEGSGTTCADLVNNGTDPHDGNVDGPSWAQVNDFPYFNYEEPQIDGIIGFVPDTDGIGISTPAYGMGICSEYDYPLTNSVERVFTKDGLLWECAGYRIDTSDDRGATWTPGTVTNEGTEVVFETAPGNATRVTWFWQQTAAGLTVSCDDSGSEVFAYSHAPYMTIGSNSYYLPGTVVTITAPATNAVFSSSSAAIPTSIRRGWIWRGHTPRRRCPKATRRVRSIPARAPHWASPASAVPTSG